MLTRFLRWMAQRGSYKAIYRDGQLYLERDYLLHLAGRAVYIHRFWSSDPDGMHCHPGNWGRIILAGGYWEESFDGTRRWYGPGHVMFSNAERFHRVIIPDDMKGKVWTLFWRGKRWRDWGFVAAPGEPWRSARSLGLQDDRPMKGWLFPRFIQ